MVKNFASGGSTGGNTGSGGDGDVKHTTKSLANLAKLNQLVSSLNSNPLDDLLAPDEDETLPKTGEKYLVIDHLTTFGGGLLVEPPDEILTTADGHKITVKAQKKKPDPDTLQPHQWIAAQGHILKKLHAKHPDELLDYFEYMTQVGDYLRDCTAVSVFWFDHLHKLDKFDTGKKRNDINQHQKDIHLKLRASRINATCNQLSTSALQQRKSVGGGLSGGGRSPSDSICWGFNSRAGCKFKNCTYSHTCLEPGCSIRHPSFQHGSGAPRFQKDTNSDDKS